jgi:transposase
MMAEQVIEVITGRERRRHWSIEEKLRIVGETFEPGASVGQIAARHEVYPGLLFTWRRHFRDGKFSPAHEPLFLPVKTPVHDLAVPRPRSGQSESRNTRHIEIELKDGSRVRVEDGVNLTTLRRVLIALRG